MDKYDITVIGSGMGGSACALLFAKLGYKVMLIERGRHPRFAIGESATPVMSEKIRHLGKAYGIPEFIDFSTYDKIKDSGNKMLCGPKELFHYFLHRNGQVEPAQFGNIPEIIVQTPEIDVQYCRAESDLYMVELAQRYGVDYLEETSVDHIDFRDDGVDLSCTKDGNTFTVNTEFVIDGTGFNSIIGKKFNLKVQGDQLQTPLKSRSIFTHFREIGDFEEVLRNSSEFVDRSPAPRARATQHHCFEGGWVWLIPFENGVTSVGLNLDLDRYPMNEKEGEAEFWEIVGKYPLIHDLLKGQETVMPFIKTGRLQFINEHMVGDRWAMLPASAYGLDAWFSTGLAVSFMAIHRLADLLHERVFPEKRFERRLIMDYETALKKEFFHVSKMINGMYKSFRHFDVFKNYCFLCFMGSENYLASGGISKGMDMRYLLLSAGDDDFVSKFEYVYDKVIGYSELETVDEADLADLNRLIREDMKPYNFREFGNPEMHSMHPRRARMDSENRCQSQ